MASMNVWSKDNILFGDEVRTRDARSLRDLIVKDASMIIVERPFVSAGSNTISVERTGAVLMLAEVYKVSVVMQEPSVPTFVQKRHRLRRKGLSTHSFDAICHLLFFITKTMKNFDESGDEKSAVRLCLAALEGSVACQNIW